MPTVSLNVGVLRGPRPSGTGGVERLGRGEAGVSGVNSGSAQGRRDRAGMTRDHRQSEPPCIDESSVIPCSFVGLSLTGAVGAT